MSGDIDDYAEDDREIAAGAPVACRNWTKDEAGFRRCEVFAAGTLVGRRLLVPYGGFQMFVTEEPDPEMWATVSATFCFRSDAEFDAFIGACAWERVSAFPHLWQLADYPANSQRAEYFVAGKGG